MALFGLALMTLSLTYCSNESSNFNIDEKTSSTSFLRESSPYLFTYTTDQECGDKLEATTSELIEDSENEISNSKDFDFIINVITVDNGQGILTERHYINTISKLIIQSEILDPGTGEYHLINVNTPISNNPYLPSITDCPKGYSLLGTCTKQADDDTTFAYSHCVGKATSKYQLAHMGTTNVFSISTTNGTSTICGASITPEE